MSDGELSARELEGLTAAEQKMRRHGQAEAAIRSFSSAYRRLVTGDAATIASRELEPAEDVPALADLPGATDSQVLDGFALIKLNGGLATSMGLEQPKTLVAAKDGRSFLDIIIGQTLALRRRHGVRLPLVLMDSEATRNPTLEVLAKHPELEVEGLPPDFLQSMIPKLDAQELTPIEWPRAPGLEWCPPGHGDVFGSLRSSGMLAALLERGFRYAMISNADNLGAAFDPRIAHHVAHERIPLLMEVVEGTEADRKGGHIARRRRDGRLILRETAQTPPEDAESFRDFRHWRFYNTNSLWVDLLVLDTTLDQHQGGLELPLIVNRKTVDPRDPDSPAVLQLESAMGAAVQSFSGAGLLCVPRTRFVPVKTTDDLLVLRSDAYALTVEMEVQPVPERRDQPPFVALDPRFYRMLDRFEARFPHSPPSLREAERLVVNGDVTFEGQVVVRGAVELDASQPDTIEAGTVLEG